MQPRSPRVRAAMAALALSVATLGACKGDDHDMTSATVARGDTSAIPDEVLRSVGGRRIYFAHQSVGRNILSGLDQALAGRDSVVRVVRTRNPAEVSGPAFMHFDAGKNEDPASKNADLLQVLGARGARDSGLVMLKYCFLDVNFMTDARRVFDGYKRTVEEVRAKHPDVTIVHVTMPLTTDATGPKAMLKRALGRPTARTANLRRNEFNDLLRTEFRGEPIFDVAALESTRPDGSRVQANLEGRAVYSLAPEYTHDGGHLNPDVSVRFAHEMMRFLATVPSKVGS